jgi:hypothetical protein
VDELFRRAAIGPVPGEMVVAAGVLFHGGWMTFALVTLIIERRHRRRDALISIA